jgi:ABC-type spermidine/putrescine transport system permease subunit II
MRSETIVPVRGSQAGSRRGTEVAWRLLEPVLVWLPPALLVAPLGFLFVGAFTVSWDSRGLRGATLQGVIQAFGMRESIVFSLLLATATAVITTAVAAPLAYATQGRSGWFVRTARDLAAFPAVVPSLMLGMGLILAYPGLQGGWLILLIAHVMQALPFAIWPIASALIMLDTDTLDRAGRTLGASTMQRFLLVALPNIWRAVATGAATAFVISFSESSSSLFLGSARYRPIGVVLVDTFSNLDQRLSAGTAVVFTVVLLPALIALELLLASSRHPAQPRRTGAMESPKAQS